MKDITPVTKDDESWIKPLFEEHSYILGPFGMAWHFYWKNDKPHEKWVKIGEGAFAHYLEKKNGEKSLYEICVKEKKKGYGKMLIDHIGFPMELKTDFDNEESNAFYKKLGFVCLGTKLSKNGKKKFNIYKRWS